MWAFDERIFNNSNLRNIYIGGNECANEVFIDDTPNRDVLRAEMEECFANFRSVFP